jgi:O-antigen/teichoic acid export membrane protein
MKKTIETILNTPLLKNSLIVFIGSFGVNVLNYLYNLVMVRLLPKEDFGELISIVSLLTIINIFAGGINLIVTRFTASIHVKHSQSAVKAFMNNFIRLIFPFSIVISIFFILSIPQLGTYLGLNDTLPLWILSIFIFFSFFAPIPLSVIQGLHRFRAFSFLTFFAGCTKFIFSILFIFTIPFISRVSSAILGIVLSGVCVFFLSFFFIRDIRIKQPATSTKIEWKALLTYAIPAFIAFSGITLLANIDIILANAMLSDPLSSANYAGLSTLGKIIFYATGVIPMVLYPLVSTKHSKEESSHRLFFSSIIIIFLAGGCAFFVYQTFPELIISLLLGDFLR